MESSFAERLRLTREKQEEVANGIGINKTTFSNYENGVRRPDYETVTKIALYLNISIDYLLGITDDPKGEMIRASAEKDYSIISRTLKEYMLDKEISQEEKDKLFQHFTSLYWKGKE